MSLHTFNTAELGLVRDPNNSKQFIVDKDMLDARIDGLNGLIKLMVDPSKITAIDSTKGVLDKETSKALINIYMNIRNILIYGKNKSEIKDQLTAYVNNLDSNFYKSKGIDIDKLIEFVKSIDTNTIEFAYKVSYYDGKNKTNDTSGKFKQWWWNVKESLEGLFRLLNPNKQEKISNKKFIGLLSSGNTKLEFSLATLTSPYTLMRSKGLEEYGDLYDSIKANNPRESEG